MTDIFISYSRKNADFVRRLYEALDRSGREVWIDWESIPRGEEFLKTIYDGIDAADVFLCVISQHSLTSEICNLEIRHARRRQKKIIPIMVELIEGDVFNAVVAGWFKKTWENDARENWDTLKAINWSIFTPDRDFDTEFKALTVEIETDRPHVRLHTRYLVAAKDWQIAGRTPSLLLIGDQIGAAETWLREAADKSPPPTEDQRNYIVESRKAEDARLAREKRQRRTTIALLVATAIAVLIGIPSVFVSINSAQTAAEAQHVAAAARTDQGEAAAAQHAAELAAGAANTQSANLAATLTPIPSTLEEADRQIAARVMTATRAAEEAGTQVWVLGATLTPIPVTLAAGQTQIAAVGTQVREAQDFAAALRLAALAQEMYDTGGDYPLALALAFEASVLSPIPQSERVLSEIAYDPGVRFQLTGHADWVTDIAYSPDGLFLVSTSDDGSVLVWNAVTGEIIDQLEVSPTIVESVAFSPDGTQIATGSSDGIITIWDARTLTKMRDLTESWSYRFVKALAYSPDGRQLSAGTGNGEILIFDVSSGRVIHTLEGHTDQITQLAYSPSGKTIVSASWDNTLILWNTLNGELISTLDGHTEWVTGAAFSPDERTIASVGYDDRLILWDASSGEVINQLTIDSASSIAFNTDGSRLAVGQINGSVLTWDTSTWELMNRLSGHTGNTTRVTFSPDGLRIASASQDTTIIVWDILSGAVVRRQSEHTTNISNLAFSPDGQHFVSSAQDSFALIWDTATGLIVNRLEPTGDPVTNVMYSPDGTRILTISAAVGADSGCLTLWDAVTGEPLHESTANFFGTTVIRYQLDGQQFAIGAGGGTLSLYDGENGELLHRLETGSTTPIWAIAFSPDGSQLFSGGYLDSAIVWDTATGERIHSLQGDFENIIDAAYSPDGTQIAAAAYDGTLIVWDAATGEVLHRFDGHSGSLNSVLYAAQGSRLIAGTDNGVLLIWDIGSGELVRRIDSGLETVNNLALSPDERLIATGTYEGDIYLWRNDTLEQLQTWTRVNRQFVALTCEQRITYGLTVDGQCIDAAAVPTSRP